ncbi:23S rRNA (guanosine(2251)-2'-O)-methyltransferase RlmB [Synechococcus sp. WH 8016]|uniref:23S rRNA (guanosine(2251)-2'-O)-methyltransferase RlmB n=1 Tax=Synechococcus sp. WH 8016 TaxID=166318 RepID=UPI00022DA13A|nr:23S rRNA (guanosine(2251)-2'-O)-methyltransferase RlmB [Synechococcus sp. WH 8016]EHA63706.1 RNA methyltransferase, TrmH family, group 3 [Synechococcus sp. WH 8016]
MSSRFDRRPPSGSGSGSGSRGRRPFRDGSPPIRRDRDDSWGGRPENGSSDRRSSDRRPSDRRFSERRSGDAYGTDRRPAFDRRSSDRRPSDRQFSDRKPSERKPSDRQSSDRRPSDRRFSERRFKDPSASDRRPSFDRSSDRSSDRASGDRSLTDRSSSDRFSDSRPPEGSFSDQRFSDRRFKDSGSTDRRPSFDRRSSDRSYGERRARFAERRGQAGSGQGGSGGKRFSPRLDDKPRGESSPHAPEAVADDLLWGRHATQAALEAGRPIHRIWCTSELRSASKFLQLLRDAKSSGVLVEEVTWARLGQLTGGAVHQGIVLQTAAAETFDLGDLVKGCSALDEAPLLLALDGLTDPHNLGAIVRSAEALGAHGVVLPQRRSAGLTGSVAKVAAGALEHLPVARVVNLNRSLETLKSSGYRVIGLAEEGDLTLEEVDLDGPLVIVTGSEGQGLSMLTRRHCDQLIRIPLRGVTPSLNASVATALCVYEVARRGWMKGLKGQNPSPRITRPQLAGSALATAPASAEPGDAPISDPSPEQPASQQPASQQPASPQTSVQPSDQLSEQLSEQALEQSSEQSSEEGSEGSVVNLDLGRESEMSGPDAFAVSIDL